jgi:hypothetical protein
MKVMGEEEEARAGVYLFLSRRFALFAGSSFLLCVFAPLREAFRMVPLGKQDLLVVGFHAEAHF